MSGLFRYICGKLFSGDDFAVFFQVHTGAFGQFHFLFFQHALVVDNPVLYKDGDAGRAEVHDGLYCHPEHLRVGGPQVAAGSVEVYEALASECGRE